MNEAPDLQSRVITCRGARATERRLLDEILDAQSLQTDFSRPVRIIVPSKSLRQHLLVRLVRKLGARAGLVVQTAYSAAREVLANAEVPTPSSDAFFDLVVRRLGRGEEALASKLEALDDGYGPVAGVVRDLLDAGFQSGHEEAVLEKLDDLEKPVTQKRLERARAIVRIAARSYEAMAVTDTWRSAHTFEMADGLLQERCEEVLPTSAVFIHGFADLTGLVGDFLETLSTSFPTAVLIDQPGRPDGSGRVEPGTAFLTRMESRFNSLDQEEDEKSQRPPDLSITQAGEVESEMRWVAERARALIDDGVIPEEIGIVARQFDGLAYPLRRHLRRLGVSHSGVGEGVAGGGCRQAVIGLTEILRAGPRTPVDLWIESRPGDWMGLLLALRQLGLVRLDDLASLTIGGDMERGVRLPVAIRPFEPNEPSGGRTVTAAELRQAQKLAASLVDIFENWPDEGATATHFENTVGVLDALGWTSDDPAWGAVMNGLKAVTRELEVIPDLEKREWLRLLAERLGGLGDESIGGVGGGVQLLNVTEARARTFKQLFLVGFNRGVFPRVAGDDSLLPDAIRARLALDVLPEMPVRARSADEERYLFAQLLSAAPDVHLSWHLSASGSVKTRSPFVAEVLAGNAPDPVAPPLWSTVRADLGPRPPYEHAILAAAGGTRSDLSPVLAEAIAAGGVVPPGPDADELAGARVDVLEEVDPTDRDMRPNPWFGFVGSLVSDEEVGPAVTTIEGIAECPWASFVKRVLGVKPLPDPQLGLPSPKGILVGQVVHRVLEFIVRQSVGQTSSENVEDMASRTPRAVPWPDSDSLAEILAQASREVAAEAGLGPLGMGPLLAASSRPYLEVARIVDWDDGGLLNGALATEVSGVSHIEGVDQPLRFRADRVDRSEAGLCLVDYKTGKPVSDKQQLKTRKGHFLTAVRKGRLLQGAVYAASVPDGTAKGSYLSLKPNIGEAPVEARWAEVAGTEADFAEALTEAVAAVQAARQAGSAFPRVEEVGSENTPSHCDYCDIKELCRRDDSGFRRRLVAWMESSDRSRCTAESAARNLWHLGTSVEDN